MAVGTMAASAVLDPGLARPALAHEHGDPAAGAAPERGEQPVRSYAIPAGSLGAALTAFEAVSGLKVTGQRDGMRDLPSPGVTGVHTAEQALRQLLSGSGVGFRFTAPDAVTLELRVRESVVVTGRVSAPSSLKYTEELRDTPQTLVVVPREVIDQQAATTLREVLQNVPGLTIAAGEGGTPAGDNLTLRGFSARNDIFVDGVRDLGPLTRDTFNVEQVEVAKGPSSVYAGRGSTGGTINMVSKTPLPAASRQVALALGSAATHRITADLNQPLRGLGPGAALRLNVMGHEAQASGREVVEGERWGIAPSIAVGLGGDTRATVSYYHLRQDNLSDYGIPWVPATNAALPAFRDRPAPVPRDTYYGLLHRDHEDLSADLATLRVEHDFGDAHTLRSQLRYGYSERDSMATPPRFAADDSTVINREMRSWLTEDEVWDNQTDVVSRFSTGSVDHALTAGLALSHEGNVRRTRTAPNMPTTLLNPDPNDVFPDAITPGPVVGDVAAWSGAVYAFDTAHLSRSLELTGGLRWDYFDADGVNTTGAEVGRVDRLLSGRAAVVYKPRPFGSVYAAYGTSLNPSLEGLSYGVANTAIEPEKTRTIEVGTKWDLMGERLSLAGSAFRVEKTNARTPGVVPGDPPQVLEGRQRVDGVELGASGTLARGWSVFAAYTFLDSEIVESNTPTEVGKSLSNTPPHAFSLWTTYQLPFRTSVGMGTRYVGRRFGNNSNTRQVDAYWTLDAMVACGLGRRLELRLNLQNLTDEYYFDRLGGGHLIPGPARSALLTTAVRF
jgi:catecholate siderophore receptor